MAARVADIIGAPLDVVVVRKIASPANPEAAIGATTAAGPPLFDHTALTMLGVSEEHLSSVTETEQAEAYRRQEAYRGDQPEPEIAGRDVIVVDDGLATGMSARAALTAVREKEPASLVLAVPVGAPNAMRSLADVCDQVVCLYGPPDFQAVSLWYERFPQVSDDEVRSVLEQVPRPARTGASPDHGSDAPAP